MKPRHTTADPQPPIPAARDPERAVSVIRRFAPSSWAWLTKLLGWTVLAAAVCAALAITAVELRQQTHISNETLDFANFYTAGKIARSGDWSRLYDLGLQRHIEHEVSPGGPFMPFFHPPFEVPVFEALAGLSYSRAFLIWGMLNLAATSLVIFLSRAASRHLDGLAYTIWLIMCLFFVISNLAVGQDALWLAVVFLAAFLCLKRRRDYAAGLALGIGLFRFEILLPFVFIFLLRRRWKLFAGFSTAGALAFVTSVGLVGWRGLMSYSKSLLVLGIGGAGSWTDQSSGGMMPSLRGMLGLFFGGSELKTLAYPVILAATLLLLIWTSSNMRHLGNPESRAFDLEFSLAIIGSLLSSYHVFIGELTPLIVAGFLILAYEHARPHEGPFARRKGSTLLILFLATIAGLIAIHSEEFSLEVIVLFGLMIWLSKEVSSPEALGVSGIESS